MIIVIASIKLKPRKVQKYLKVLNQNAIRVREETGCIQYLATTDYCTDIPNQSFNKDTVTIIETWQNMSSFLYHRQSEHMITYREDVKDLVESTSLRILSEAC